MGQHRTVAFVMAHDSYGLSLMRGAATYVAEESDWEITRTHSISSTAPTEPVDGVVGQFQSVAAAQHLIHKGVKVVNVSHFCQHYPLPRVGPDDLAIGRLAADHLVERGYRWFSFFGIDTHWYSRQRRIGFTDRLRALGRERFLRPCFDHPADGHDPNPARWLADLPLPIGVLACNDLRARAVADLCKSLHLRVPDDVGIVGVDNDEWQPLIARMPLTSVDPGPHQIGYAGARMLATLFAGRSPADAHVLVPPRGIVVRRSTDVVLLDDPVVQQACRWVRENAHRPILIDDAVLAAGVSRRTLEVRARKGLGRTLQEIIWQAHVDRAKTLLTTTQLPMKVIAQRAGFSSQKQLNVIFRRHTRVTPTEFRQAERGPRW